MSKLCPTFNNDQQRALQTLNIELRRILKASIHLNASTAELQAMSEQLGGIADQFESQTSERLLPQFNPSAIPGDPNSFLPYSPVSGRFNATAPPIEFSLEERDGTTIVIGEVNFNRVYEGPPNCVHGAWVAAVYDQILAYNTLINSHGGPTAYLHVDYLLPTFVETDLRFEAWIDKVEGKKIYTKGQCYANGEVVTTSEALFIAYQPKS